MIIAQKSLVDGTLSINDKNDPQNLMLVFAHSRESCCGCEATPRLEFTREESVEVANDGGLAWTARSAVDGKGDGQGRGDRTVSRADEDQAGAERCV